MSVVQSKYWMFTSYNSDLLINHEDFFQELITAERLLYVAYQIEKCPSTDRMHIQGYCVLPKRARMTGVKTLFSDQALHLEKRRGSHLQAIEYCTKDESRISGPYTFGCDEHLRGSKKRKLDDIKLAIDGGARETEIADEFFGLWCRYHKAFKAYELLKQPGRDFKTEVRVYYGKSGVGKSRRATYEAGLSAYRKPLGEWWDGYDGKSNVIIDDYYGWLRFDELLRCFDRYSHRVPVKGGFVNFSPKLIIVTSNVEPRKWYDEEKINSFRFEALIRRFETVEEMVDDWVEPEGSVNFQ